MNRSRFIFAVFTSCLIIVLAAMAWVSTVAVRSDRRDAQAQQQAERAENARLALWRMESALGPIIAQEDARPYYEYFSFYSPPIVLDAARQVIPSGRVVLPSPLLANPKPLMKLHFLIAPSGRISSPHSPKDATPDLLDSIAEELDQPAVIDERLRALTGMIDRETLSAAAPKPADAGGPPQPPSAGVVAASTPPANDDAQQVLVELNASNQLRQSSMPLAEKKPGRARYSPVQQELRSTLEYQQRVEANLQNAYFSKLNRSASNPSQQSAHVIDASANEAAVPQDDQPAAPSIVREGEMTALWIDGQLLLARRVEIDKQTWVQGCWLDWEAIREWLLQRVVDLLPNAQLTPVDDSLDDSLEDAERGDLHLLAALPVRLIPGEINGADDPLSSPIRTSLVVAWTCAGLAIAAVVVLVSGMAALSERRAAFVSAVTHELRTPLTTFRMYTQMLADGMITDEPRRREYLGALRTESDRLAQLIENVLSYARLERRRPVERAEDAIVGEAVDRFAERLRQRTEQAQMELLIELDEASRRRTFRTDVSAVEQIVYNLVDNACKYAADAKDRRIHLQVTTDAKWLRLNVTDHGPGVSADVAGRLFRPFSKSAKSAASSAQGVGLGLALSRRLARRLGGDLRLSHSDGNGCRFELKLPCR